MGEARCWNLHIPLFHPKVVLLEQQRVLFNIFMLVICSTAVSVVAQDPLHKLSYSIMNQF